MKYLLDTNVFLRILVNDDEKMSRECGEVVKKIRSNEIEAITTGLVLAELTWTLKSTYKLKRIDIAEKVSGITGLNNLRIIDNYDWVKTLEIYEKYNVKFVDAAIASIKEVRQKEWTLVSYDEDFGKLPVKWLKPGQV